MVRLLYTKQTELKKQHGIQLNVDTIFVRSKMSKKAKKKNYKVNKPQKNKATQWKIHVVETVPVNQRNVNHQNKNIEFWWHCNVCTFHQKSKKQNSNTYKCEICECEQS